MKDLLFMSLMTQKALIMILTRLYNMDIILQLFLKIHGLWMIDQEAISQEAQKEIIPQDLLEVLIDQSNNTQKKTNLLLNITMP